MGLLNCCFIPLYKQKKPLIFDITKSTLMVFVYFGIWMYMYDLFTGVHIGKHKFQYL